MNTQQDFELTAQEIVELKALFKSLISSHFWSDLYPLTDPKEVKQYLAKITHLDLQPQPNKGFITLPTSIKHFTNLEILDLNETSVRNNERHYQSILLNLTVLSENIKYLNKLHTLSISDQILTLLPEHIGQLKQLKTLNLSGLNLTTLPESIGELKQLQTLTLSFNPLLSNGIVFPDSIGELCNLKKLELLFPITLALKSAEENLTFPENFWQLNQLEELNISCLNLSRLPENIGQLKGLKTLEISSCPNLTTLPESIGSLENLQTLNIVSCQKLSYIPENIAHLKNIKRLNIVSCENLTDIPLFIQKLSTFTLYENYWDWSSLRMEELEKQHKKTQTPKAKPILTREQKQAKKVVAQMKKDTATPFIKIKPKKAKKLPLTASKFGGVPYWLPEMPYPVDKNGDKLALLAQIDLAELPPLPDFPEKGLLQFFISNDDLAGLDTDIPLSQKGYRVVYHESVNPNISEKEVLDLAIPLENMPLGDTQYQLSFDLGSQSMGLADYRFEKLFKTTAEKLKIKFDEDDELLDLIEEETYDKLHNSTA
ncbi:MAG: DUF1963 domain-containing protein, partial [Neisseriaceae bacterium]|nr:DUF1963 domain-containing protein [Neisseriaceae bacterium]